MKNNDAELSYQRYSEMEATQADALCMPACFVAPDTVDAWRHRCMYEMLNPLIEENLNEKWLTVGAGSYGLDADFLQQKGVDILASSLTVPFFEIVKEKRCFEKYSAVNVEQIPYEDEAFDFVLCKEAYRHFSRPVFCEMLRVAKDAVVLIKSYDGLKWFLDIIKSAMKRFNFGKIQTIYFEPSGNFIYRINPSEMGEKLAAMGYAAVAYKTFNDIYLPKFGNAIAGVTVGHFVTKLAIFLQDIISTFRFLISSLIILVAFEGSPSEALELEMKKIGYMLKKVPINSCVHTSGDQS